MIKPLLSLAFLFHVGIAAAAEPLYSFTPYENPDNIIKVGRPGDKKLQKFAKLADPAISPDGKQVVCTLFLEKGRRLTLLDIATGKTKQLPIEAREMYGAMWSPDGKWIAFNILNEHWGVGIIHPDGTGLKVLTKGKLDDKDVNVAGWNFKTGELLAHDLDTLWQLDLDGGIVWKHEIKDITAPNGVDSSCRFWVLPDGKTLIGNVEVLEDEIKNIDGPSDFLITVDLETKKHERISPKGLHVGNPILTYDATSILFHGFENGDIKPLKDDAVDMTMRTYRMTLSDHKVVPIFQNSMDITQAKE